MDTEPICESQNLDEVWVIKYLFHVKWCHVSEDNASVGWVKYGGFTHEKLATFSVCQTAYSAADSFLSFWWPRCWQSGANSISGINLSVLFVPEWPTQPPVEEWDTIPQQCVTSWWAQEKVPQCVVVAVYGSYTCYWGTSLLNDEIVKFSNMSCFFRFQPSNQQQTSRKDLSSHVILYITVKIKYTDAHSSVRDFSCKSVASQSRGKLKTAIKGLRIIQASVFNTGVGCRHMIKKDGGHCLVTSVRKYLTLKRFCIAFLWAIMWPYETT